MTIMATPTIFDTCQPRADVLAGTVAEADADYANPERFFANTYPTRGLKNLLANVLAKQGYERVRKSDEDRIAPGSDTLRELFGGEPTLILLDELFIYLRKIGKTKEGRGQLTAFLTSLFKAVESAPNAALVYTLAIGKDGQATDAYGEENQFIADQMAEAASVSARKATLLNPTEEDETIQVLRRRLSHGAWLCVYRHSGGNHYLRSRRCAKNAQ